MYCRRGSAKPSLNDLEANRSADISSLEVERARLVKKSQKLAEEGNKLQDVDDRFLKKLADHNNEIAIVKAKLTEAYETYEQARRKIFHQYPQPGDPEFTEFKGGLYTAEEIANGNGSPRLLNVEKERRARLLADLERRRLAEIPALEADEAKFVEVGKKLAQESDKYRNIDPLDPRALSAYNTFMKQLNDLLEKVTAVRDRLAERRGAHEQERRYIISQFPEPGDVQFTEYKGVLYTAEELNEAKAFEEAHASPRQAADEYTDLMVKKGTIRKAEFEKSVMIPSKIGRPPCGAEDRIFGRGESQQTNRPEGGPLHHYVPRHLVSGKCAHTRRRDPSGEKIWLRGSGG